MNASFVLGKKMPLSKLNRAAEQTLWTLDDPSRPVPRQKFKSELMHN